ncbi:zinc finger protein [Trichonephila clavipes]|uniref:Zinc finger protein n=1 Tax=Trichonephila clavipes TaxID=2585209 RepID=A0A8X6RNG1_TRICX|nr:zinc finger protein [Trichonephila clavipes]
MAVLSGRNLMIISRIWNRWVKDGNTERRAGSFTSSRDDRHVTYMALMEPPPESKIEIEFFVSPKGDWRQLVALAKLIAPSFQSQMSGRFLKVTVADDVDYRALSKWLESSGVEFKSFMLKQDRPVKVVIRGLPSNTEPEEIKAEIETEGFKY